MGDDCFLRAYYEHSLFELKARVGPKGDAHIGFVGPLMLPNSQGKPYVHEFLVGWKRERPLARLYSHEYLTQFSAAGELVGIYNQPDDRLVAELPLVREIAGQMNFGGYAIDLAVLNGSRPAGRPVIGAEIKLTKQGHCKLITALRGCGGLQACGSDHRKCLWIRQTRSVRYLWVRSQDQGDLFEIKRAGDTGFDIQQVPTSEVHSILSRQDWN